MTTRTRVSRLEAMRGKESGPVVVVVCWCGPDEKHKPGCPAAGCNDALVITWPDGDSRTP